MSKLNIELTNRQFLILRDDLNLEQEGIETFTFDLGYLARKVVGHDKELFCEGVLDVEVKNEIRRVYGLDVIFHFEETDEVISDDDYKEIVIRTEETILSYLKY